jgi:hypothetical protein
MLVISKIHPDLLKILTEFSDFFYNRDFSHLEPCIETLHKDRKLLGKDSNKHSVSMEYLQEALKDDPMKYGFPKHSWGLELFNERTHYNDAELKQRAAATNDKLLNFFGARNNALQMFYPSGGCIGWHNNCNAPGYNIVLSCNPGGNGYFSHWDHINNKLNQMDDEPGWNCKAGYFGSPNEPEKIYWHCAYTETPRLTFSYIVYDKNIWEDMVADIEYAG